LVSVVFFFLSLSLFDDTHIRLLKISALPAEGRGYEEFLFYGPERGSHSHGCTAFRWTDGDGWYT
jgi:hypothetical protein